MNVRVTMNVKGQVQGVGFRKATLRKARELQVTGWVRNLQDGSVEACFEGSSVAVDLLLCWCSMGPERAWVLGIESRRGPYRGEFSDFEIRHDDAVGEVAHEGRDQALCRAYLP